MAEAGTHSLVRALRGVPELEELDERSLVEIVGCSTNLLWSAGSAVFLQDEPAEALYIVLSGQVRIEEGEREIATVGPGESFGELSMLLHAPHRRSAHAVEDAELLVVPKDEFQRLLASDDQLAARFRRKVETRLPSPAES